MGCELGVKGVTSLSMDLYLLIEQESSHENVFSCNTLLSLQLIHQLIIYYTWQGGALCMTGRQFQCGKKSTPSMRASNEWELLACSLHMNWLSLRNNLLKFKTFRKLPIL